MPRHQITLHWPIVEFQGTSNKQKKIIKSLSSYRPKAVIRDLQLDKNFQIFFNDLSEVPQMCLKRIISKK